MEARTFWDNVALFHQRASRDYGSVGAKGLKAVIRLREALESHWKPEASTTDHPLYRKLMWASAQSYEGLVLFDRKLVLLRKLRGGDGILNRMGAPSNLARAALSEADAAMKFSLAGYRCEFISPSEEASPDLLVHTEEGPLYVEVTSLNPSDQEQLATAAFSAIFDITFFRRAIGGSMFARPPDTAAELEQVRRRVEAALEVAEAESRLVKDSIPGLVTFYVAPRELASEIPERFRGRGEMRDRARPPKSDRLARKVSMKTKRQLPEGSSSFLIIYDHLAWAEDLKPLFVEPRPDIETVIATFPNLAGVALVHSFTAFSMDQEKFLESDDRVFIRHALPGAEAEDVVAWRNPVAHHSAFEWVWKCLAEFPSNLVRWESDR